MEVESESTTTPPPPEESVAEPISPAENGENGLLEDEKKAAGSDEEDDEEEGKEVNYGDDSDSDSDIVVTIGDIKTNLPLQRRGFPVQKLDPNVIPTIQGKNIFDVNPTEFDDKPWLKSGANIADYFNFGFNEETWNEYAEKQRLMRLEYPGQAEVNRVIMDELRGKHGNKDAGVPIVMPVHNSGGRNLVTIQSFDSKPPVKVGFPTQNNIIPINTSAAENLPPMIRNLVTGFSQNNTAASSLPQQASQIPTVNLTIPTIAPITPTKPIVVDLTKPPPNFNINIPPPNFNAPQPSIDSPNLDIKPDLPPGTLSIPAVSSSSSSTTGGTNKLPFNPNVPPPMFPIRLPATNLTNLSRPMNYGSRPPMGNYYNNSSMGSMNAPPPGMLRHHSSTNEDEGPPGISGSQSSTTIEGPPGTEGSESYRSSSDRLRRKERESKTRRSRSRSPRRRERDYERSSNHRDRGDREYDSRERDRSSRKEKRRSRSPVRERRRRERSRS